MFLEKLEIQGFKSFANKNVLVFPGMVGQDRRGLTAIVGPNGSGKSNVADSVRWALGEQSMKTLRGKRSEDVIFSGSDKKGKLGMSEVSLYLNNEDNKAPIDYSEIVITRRLYRDGESEYLVNNSRVRLSDIQMMLAKANFGQKTYSVIGQGMVEGFLNTSLSERKEFFDEATGVKQYQIKRDDALNKLSSSHENLSQAQMLLTEIAPRLKSLTRQVSRLKKREEIELELKKEQTIYYGRLWHENNNHFNNYNFQYLELEKNKTAKDKKLAALQSELEQLKLSGGQENEFNELQNELSQAQNKQHELKIKLAKLDVQLEAKLEANGKFDLSFLIKRQEDLNKDILNLEDTIKNLSQELELSRAKNQELLKEKDILDKSVQELNISLIKAGQNTDQEAIKKINNDLKNIHVRFSDIKFAEDLDEIKKFLAEIEEEIAQILALSFKLAGDEATETGADRWKKIEESLSKLNFAREEIYDKIQANNSKISSQGERRRLSEENLVALRAEVADVVNKLKQNQQGISDGDAEKERAIIKKSINDTEEIINVIKERISRRGRDEETKLNRLFSLQQNLQEIQNEINSVSNKLNELKVSAARFETKLEDLEIEIRQELGGLHDIKQNRPEGEINMEEVKSRISQHKKQLELIGGIDPQTEKEFDETKERYDFLFGQISDLSKAVDSLQVIIKELDVTIKERFDKEFKIIEKKFEEYFKILFNGGTAKIIKVIEDEMKEQEPTIAETTEEAGASKPAVTPADAEFKKIKYLQKYNATGLAGIEIQATPPGKKIKSITMLSGGERALTAIALICAIISSNPSPFVVLDEVDAALDEANSERLAKILDELSHKTQFIVITHNRASMRRANVLYGVTMTDEGVSKLLSIKLDEAEVKN